MNRFKTNHILRLLTVLWSAAVLGGCSAEDEAPAVSQEGTVPVHFKIKNENLTLKAPGDVSLSVNRILILPFIKTNESLPNDPSNFTPVYAAAKQMDVSSFPVISSKLNLSAASTYGVMVLGYNRNDYDFNNQASASRRFDIGPATSATLNNLYLQPTSTVSVPEFFSCMGTGYQKTTSMGTYFKPGTVTYIQGNLQRLVSGISLDITNIPGFVTSITLVAEQLVTASKATAGTPLLWQTPGDAGVKTLSKQVPVAGKVSFNQYMLPTLDARKTLFYLDVGYGTLTKRYTMKVADSNGVASGNRITFTPNHWVKITGSYANINLGFVISANINLDDNKWDGLQGGEDD